MEKKKEMLTAIFIDIADYTKTSGKLNLDTLDELHQVFDALVIRSVEQHNGQIIKKIGDAFLITFKTSTSAVHCGIELQRQFEDYNKSNPNSLPLRIRVAIHTGEVLLRGKDIYGDMVNTTSRIEGITKPGDIIFSETVYATMDKNDIPPFIHLGTKRFKGVKKPVRLFKIKTRADVIRARRKRFEKFFGSIGSFIRAIIILGLIALTFYLLMTYL